MIWYQRNRGLLLASGLLLLSAYIANAQPAPAVSANSKECMTAGVSALRMGGSAVDSAITTYLCETINRLQGFALGGGFIMKIWDSNTKTGSILTAKEQAPVRPSRQQDSQEKLNLELNLPPVQDNEKSSASKQGETSFVVKTEALSSEDGTEQTLVKVDNDQENPEINLKPITPNKGKAILIEHRPGLKIEIPGIIAGFWEVHQKYGRLPWSDLIQYVIALNANIEDEGIIMNPKLLESLKKIRDFGKDIFYKGEIAENLVREIQAVGGSITLDDFKNYKPHWQDNGNALPNSIEFIENNDPRPHASILGKDGFCVTVQSTNANIPSFTFKSKSTGIILKEI